MHSMDVVVVIYWMKALRRKQKSGGNVENGQNGAQKHGITCHSVSYSVAGFHPFVFNVLLRA